MYSSMPKALFVEYRPRFLASSFVIPYTYAFTSGLSPFDTMSERRSGRTVHKGSTLSAARKEARAARTQAEIAAKKAPPEPKAPIVKDGPSVRPYRKPEPTPKIKRVVTTVSDRDGLNLLRKIEAKGGRDVIIMMRDSERTPQELAEYLILNEDVVITSLNAYGSGKNRTERLLAAIAQAPVYLKNDDERPVTTGVRKQKRQVEALAKQQKIAAEKKKQRIRKVVVPTVAEMVPTRSDQQIMLEELKRYLEQNLVLRQRVLSAPSESKVARILEFGVGQRFDTRVKALLASPSEYQTLLGEAGAAIVRDTRKCDTPATPSGPAPSVQESPEVLARRQSQLDAIARFDAATRTKAKEIEPVDDNPEEDAQREIFSRQEEILKAFIAIEEEPL